MAISDLLLPEFDQEMANTRRVLERVPDSKFGWKPHEKSWSMGELASHIANMIGWGDTMNETKFDVTSVSPEEMNRAASRRRSCCRGSTRTSRKCASRWPRATPTTSCRGRSRAGPR